MDVDWPKPGLLSNQPLHGIEDFLYALDLESQSFSLSQYPCIFVESNKQPRYAGKMWLIEDAERKPVAFVRVVYGRHVVSCSGAQAAHLFFEQTQWLRENSSSSDVKGEFRPAYVMYPELGIDILGICGGRLRDIEHVVMENINDGGARYSLLSFENFSEIAKQQLDARINLIEEVRRSSGGNFPGLPA